jgi:GNAT superfamily N-acetyltransferase
MSTTLVTYDDTFLPEIKEIFFESSVKKDFKDEAEKEAFFYKYAGFYLHHFPELCFVALKEKRVMGYVLGSTITDSDELLKLQPHLKIFASEYVLFPAHLHINCHHESRGMGLGRILIAAFERALNERNINGLHIMTGVNSENRKFYKKVGFDHEVMEDFHGSVILFMGKKL